MLLFTSLLPRYRPLFETAGRHQDLPWTLLAAQAYQESHWNPEATSPTGVRGREPVRYVQRIRDFHDILQRSVEAGELDL